MRFTVVLALLGAVSAIRLGATITKDDDGEKSDDPTAQEIFEKCDANKDNKLDLQEAVKCAVEAATEKGKKRMEERVKKIT